MAETLNTQDKELKTTAPTETETQLEANQRVANLSVPEVTPEPVQQLPVETTVATTNQITKATDEQRNAFREFINSNNVNTADLTNEDAIEFKET
jgi:hypothetical protein